MGLLQRNPFRSESTKPLYTMGFEKTVILVGLGNLGKRYEKTRHNVGFVCIDAFAKEHEFDRWIDKKDLKCQLAVKPLGDTRIILVKPSTMMNLSGEAVQAVAHFYKVEASHIIAIYDEAAVPFGQIRTRLGGSSAGHNGVKSLIQHLGDGFGRVRIGIQGDSQMATADYVLARFSKDELAKMPGLTKEVSSILTEYVYGGELPHDTRSFLA